MSNILTAEDVADLRAATDERYLDGNEAVELCDCVEALRAQVEERDRAIAALVEAMEYASEAFKPVVRLRYFPEGGEQVGNHIHCELALQRIKAAIAHAEALAGGGK